MDTAVETLHSRFTTRAPRLAGGRHFVGIASSKIFCRPICRKRMSGLANCLFFASATEALAAGFAPCGHCRPELLRDLPGARGTLNTVVRALRMIAAGEFDEDDGRSLASRLGIGERHLRRLFHRHVGTSPWALLHAQRMYLAEQMARETTLPMTEIGYASGFRSLRRFNAAIKEHFGCSPRALRQRHPTDVGNAPHLRLRILYLPPYDWAVVVRYLRMFAIPHVEHVGARCYRRSARLGDKATVISVEQDPGSNHLIVNVAAANVAESWRIVQRLRVLFDVGTDPQEVAGSLRQFPELEEAVAEHPGVRVPGAWDRFEMIVRALVECEGGPASQATLGRIAHAFGREIGAPFQQYGIDRTFPEPADLACADLASTGVSRRVAGAINAIAADAVKGSIRLDSGEAGCALERRLVELGIDAQTAQYVVARSDGDGDAVPFADWRVRSISEGPGRPWGPLPPANSQTSAPQTWTPWQAHAAVALWAHHANDGARVERGENSPGQRPPPPLSRSVKGRSLREYPCDLPARRLSRPAADGVYCRAEDASRNPIGRMDEAVSPR